jgi:hypothetical protein
VDRPILYDQASARDYDMLHALRDASYAISQLTGDLLGSTSTIVSNPAAAPTGPASLSINLGAFDIYQLADVDAAAYGSLDADTRQTMQQGFAAAQQVTLSTAGLSAGQSRWALIEVTYSQIDSIPADDPNSGVLPYLNVNDPFGPPWAGPSNSGATQNTLRSGVASVKVVYGNIAATGSEVPPNPDTGYVPLYLIDLSFGQTAITSGQIIPSGPSVGTGVPSNYPAAPIFTGFAGISTQISNALSSLAAGNGQCRLSYVDATHIQLMPVGGNNIKIAGANKSIPAGGVSITNAGLANSTLYYVYLLNNPGTLQLELSTTGHSTDTTAGNIGIEIKTGDNSRTLVGLIATTASGQFADQDGARLVLSYFNRKDKTSRTTFTANRSTTSNTPTEVNVEIQAKFLVWADDEMFYGVEGEQLGATSGAVGVGIDSMSVFANGFGVVGASSAISASPGSFNVKAAGELAENAAHFATLLASTVTGQTLSFWGADLNNSSTNEARTWLIVRVKG